MNLRNFEKYIEEKILERGKQYYGENRVVNLFSRGNTWHAAVRGSEDYKVQFKFSKDYDVIFTQCTCPYTCYSGLTDIDLVDFSAFPQAHNRRYSGLTDIDLVDSKSPETENVMCYSGLTDIDLVD